MRAWIAGFACLVAAGCVSTSVQRLDDTIRTPRTVETVAVLREAPQGPYTVIAIIESEGRSAFDSFEELRAEMLAEAAKLGGDAVIMGPEATEERFILTGSAMVRSEERTMRCQVIVYGTG